MLNDQNSVRLEGRVWRITYKVPKNHSTLEVIRSYRTELTKAGFKVLFECAYPACGDPHPLRALRMRLIFTPVRYRAY